MRALPLPSQVWSRGGPRPPAVLTVPALLVGAAMALPLAYLAVRSMGAPADALWTAVHRAGRDGLVCATGSMYMAGAARRIFRSRTTRTRS